MPEGDSGGISARRTRGRGNGQSRVSTPESILFVKVGGMIGNPQIRNILRIALFIHKGKKSVVLCPGGSPKCFSQAGLLASPLADGLPICVTNSGAHGQRGFSFWKEGLQRWARSRVARDSHFQSQRTPESATFVAGNGGLVNGGIPSPAGATPGEELDAWRAYRRASAIFPGVNHV